MSSQSLGRGLGSLIPKKTTSEGGSPFPIIIDEPRAGIREIALESITPNPHQPRERFSHREMDDLVSSVKQHGLLQPLLVTSRGDGQYELIAGERRLRAAKMAGLARVPVVVRTVKEMEKLELALIENLQRQDLTPMEEARAYRRLMEEYGLTQDEVGTKVGKSRSVVANMLRLLNLPTEVQVAVEDGTLPSSHARTLAGLPNPDEQKKWFAEFLAKRQTAREVEEVVAKAHPGARRVSKDVTLLAVEEELRKSYGTKVVIKNRSGKGAIELHYYSPEELLQLLEKLRSGRS